MKKMIINMMASTGITLVMLAVIATLLDAKFLYISSIFESLFANIVIHSGFILTKKFESEYVALEAALDIGYTIIVLIIFGAVFDWYGSTSLPILIIMAILIYFSGLFLSLYRMRENINVINKLLQNRNKNIND